MAHAPTKRRMKRGKNPSLLVLNITSMLDMFTILVIFLLKSYSAEGIIVPIPSDLQLPISTTQVTPEPGVIVELSRSVLVLDGTVLPIDLAAVEASQSLLIPELYDQLHAKTRQFEEIARINPEISFTGRIVLEGDREIPFSLLKKILYTAGQAGFINQSLAVLQKE